MISQLTYIRRTFHVQDSLNECGIACLKSILAYTGNKHQFEFPGSLLKDDGISLLELRALAEQCDLKAECVEFEFSFLNSLTAPVILHTLGSETGYHFIIFYGCIVAGKRIRYVIGDPAEGILILDESQLQKVWVSRAALYFYDLFPVQQNTASLTTLFKWLHAMVPFQVQCILAVLIVTVAVLGLLGTILIQHIFSYLFAESGHIPSAELYLFLAILCVRVLLNLFKDNLIINITAELNLKLSERILNGQNSDYREIPESIYRESQKIQAAISNLITLLLPDSIIVIAILLFQLSYYPILAILNFCWLIFFIGIANKKLRLVSDVMCENEQNQAAVYRFFTRLKKQPIIPGILNEWLSNLSRFNSVEMTNAKILSSAQQLIFIGNSLLIFVSIVVSCTIFDKDSELTMLTNTTFLTMLFAFLLTRMWQNTQVVYVGLNTWIEASDVLK